jgi:hypothetical protein
MTQRQTPGEIVYYSGAGFDEIPNTACHQLPDTERPSCWAWICVAAVLIPATLVFLRALAA